jgi:phosphoesterase RecJ-like protein
LPVQAGNCNFAACMKLIQEFYPLLHQPARVVITTHQKPDGDALGSSLGLFHFLQQLGHTVKVISPTNWPDFLNWLPGIGEVINFESHRDKGRQLVSEADYIFCLDFNILHRTKHLEPLLEAAPGKKILIDHHQEPQVAAFDWGISDTGKSSTCEMVYDFIVDSGHDQHINKDVAACLYTGVMTDTGSFRFPAATASVHRMVARLKDTGIRHSQIHDEVFDNFLENRLRFIGYALLNRMDVLYEYNTALMYITKADLHRFQIKTGDTEGLVNYLLSIQGIRFAALAIDRDEERKWSFRSKGDFDVNNFARLHFEGGGHFNAAGGRSSDSLEMTVNKFREILPSYLNQLQ